MKTVTIEKISGRTEEVKLYSRMGDYVIHTKIKADLGPKKYIITHEPTSTKVRGFRLLKEARQALSGLKDVKRFTELADAPLDVIRKICEEASP